MQKHKKSAEIYLTLKYILWRFWRYISMPVRAVFDSSLRAGIMARLTDRKWYSAHIDSYKQFFRPKINLE